MGRRMKEEEGQKEGRKESKEAGRKKGRKDKDPGRNFKYCKQQRILFRC